MPKDDDEYRDNWETREENVPQDQAGPHIDLAARIAVVEARFLDNQAAFRTHVYNWDIRHRELEQQIAELQEWKAGVRGTWWGMSLAAGALGSAIAFLLKRIL